jgi:TolA-binding protein
MFRIKRFFACALISIFISSVYAQKDDKLTEILEKFRSLVKEEKWEEAYNYHKECPKPDGFEWNSFSCYINDPFRHQDSNPSQKRRRAKAAKLLKVYDISLSEFQKAIDLEKDKDDKLRIMMEAAGCAFEAAMDSIEKEDYKEAEQRFDKMYQWGYTWQKDSGKEKRDLVRGLIKKQNDVAYRIEFVKKFWENNSPALQFPEWQKQSRKFLLKTLELEPDKQQHQQICRDLQRYSQKLKDQSGTEKYAKMISDKYPGTAIARESQFSLAQFYMINNKLEKSRDTLLQLLKAGKKDKFTSMATLGLSEVYYGMGDENKMIEYLKMAANEIPVPTNTNIMDTSDTNQTACYRLGEYYYKKKKYKEALKYFRKWQPISFCGTCISSMSNERNLHIAKCLVGLGKEKEALEKHLFPYITNGEGVSIQEDIPNYIIAIYERNGKLNELIKFIEPFAKKKFHEPAKMTLKLAEIRIAKRDKKVNDLVKYLGHKDIDNTYLIAATNALRDMNGQEFPGLKKHYEVLQKIPEKTKEDHYKIRYTIDAIGNSKST